MPWRGPHQRGEFPTLGYLVGDWIEANLIVPDGQRAGEKYLLTDEMWHFILRFYRLRPDAAPESGSEAFAYYGGQLVRPQKWGKDPYAAAISCAEALGPVRFAGWDSAGEPLGRGVPTPWIQCVATAEEQVDNTYRPIVAMLRDGPLADTPGLDVGDTRTKLPNGDGWIEPQTSSGRARLGARLTFATFTETHLFTERSGGVELAKNMKRNIAGMDGRWLEITNAWDPSQRSTAQRTHEAKAPGVYLDYRPPRAHVDLEDDAALREEIRYVYGDSCLHRGGWVREARIIADIRDPATGIAEGRRYFLNELVVGEHDAVDAIVWDTMARPVERLAPREKIALGFDGSRNLDATALIASRLSDGRWFPLGVWECPPNVADWRVPRAEVDAAVRGAFAAYQVYYLYGDPYRWQEELERWEAAFPDRVVQLPTNVERRMDKAVRRFLTAFKERSFTHDGSEVLTRHATNAVVTTGKKKPAHERDGEDRDVTDDHYLGVAKKRKGAWIDAFVAGLLAGEARGQAIEDGALNVQERPPPATAPSTPTATDREVWRPSGRLNI